MYLVTASITMSTPNSSGLKYNAVAHVLSIIDFKLCFLQIRTASSISITSKVYVPGVSKYKVLVLSLIKVSKFVISPEL